MLLLGRKSLDLTVSQLLHKLFYWRIPIVLPGVLISNLIILMTWNIALLIGWQGIEIEGSGVE